MCGRPLARRLLFFGAEMRNFLLVVLALAAVGYYFDISPTDFLPSLPSSEPAKERHVSAAPAQAPAPQAQPTAAATPSNSDGSLAGRWASPKP